MLIDHLPVSLAMLPDILKVFKSPDNTQQIAATALRWLHFVGGITWIGLLYFFNLINVPVQKGLDPETKKKVNPDLLGRALWYFRWGAVVTVVAGLGYYVMYILKPDVSNATEKLSHTGKTLALVWLAIPIVTFFIEFLVIKKVAVLTKDGRVYALVVLILVVAMTLVILKWLSDGFTVGSNHYASNATLSIGVGGALGIIMILNVWGIIWPNNKRIIAATAGTGPAAPPELARQAFLASRTNAWLSLPMLLFMGSAHHDWQILSGK